MINEKKERLNPLSKQKQLQYAQVFFNSNKGGNFPVGLSSPSGLKNGSDVPSILALIHPWPFAID